MRGHSPVHAPHLGLSSHSRGGTHSAALGGVWLHSVALGCRLRRFYLLGAREIKRLDAVSRSPMFALLSECLGGLATIRAFRIERDLLARFHTLHDANSRAFFHFVAGGRWLGFRLDMMSFALLATSCFAAVLSKAYGLAVSDNAGLVGAALLYVIQLAGLFQWAVRQTAELENQATPLHAAIDRSQGCL